jgi:hypothetical protein
MIQAASRWMLLVVVLALGCGGPNEYVMRGQSRATGADGNVTVGDYDDGNAEVEIEVSNLAPPARIEEDATVYVVWFQPADGRPTKAGELAYDEDDRTGTLRATSANREFTVIITAEEEGDAESPSDNVVFRQEAEVP